MDNGVIIALGGSEGAGTTEVAPPILNAPSTNSNHQQIIVTFTPSSFNSADFAEQIGHEGSHVADATDWVNSGYSDTAQPTVYQTEHNAYLISSYLAEKDAPDASYQIGAGKGVYAEKITIWDGEQGAEKRGWGEADKVTTRAHSINRILAKPKSQGGLYEVNSTSTRKPWLN